MTKFQTLPATESWATAGAMAIASNIPKCVPIIHGGPGCGFSMTWGSFLAGGQQTVGGDYGFAFPSTTLCEKDTIFGGEEKLYQTLTGPWDYIFNDPEMVFVCTGCIPDIIGDDIERVIQRAQPKLRNAKAIYAEAGGFKGRSSDGANIAINAICRQMVKPPTRKRENTVNVFGVVPYFDPYWYGDLEEIKRMLAALGIEVNAVIPGDCSRVQLEAMAEASLNVVLSDKVGIPAAEYLQQSYDMPYVFAKRGAPIGTTATNEFLTEVIDNLSLNKDDARRKLEEETKHVYKRFEQGLLSYMIRCNDTYALIATSPYALGMISFLTGELGFYPSLIALTYAGASSKANLDALLNELVPEDPPKVMIEPTSYEIREALEELTPPPSLVFGRTLEKYLMPKVRATYLSLSWPIVDQVIIDKGYMGYRGAIRFFEDLYTATGTWWR